MKKNTKPILITGGCGFVGRNLIRKLKSEKDIWVIDDLSIGQDPKRWLGSYKLKNKKKNMTIYEDKNQSITFIKADLIDVLRAEEKDKRLPNFNKIYHFASIVGGRALIDGDPIRIGKDLAIDSIFFFWLTQFNREVDGVLYASSSAAYPVSIQNKKNAKALKEKDLDFSLNLGVPDMTYGWSKLTGEYLSRLAAQRYSIPVSCVRPFSGYGEDQDFTYPIPAIAKRAVLKENPFDVWGNGKQGRDFVHIDDCIAAFFIIMKNIKDGKACNIGSGKLTTFIDVIKIFTSFSDYSPKINKLIDKPTGVSARYADTKLINSFGWKPKISNTEGFKRVFDYVNESIMDK